eukprot:Polyplicarium_translucidae@DN1997_c0_g1_i1.p1
MKLDVSEDLQKKARQILSFLLHARPRDMTKPWDPELSLAQLLLRPQRLADYIFNEQVLVALLEDERLITGYLGVSGATVTRTHVMAALLAARSTTPHLKATLCGKVSMESRIDGSPTADGWAEFIPPLVDLIQPSHKGFSSYLGSVAYSAIINISAANEAAKSGLISCDVAHGVVRQLRTDTDPELTLSALRLCVNLTKTAMQRQRFVSAGLVETVVDILGADYAYRAETKLRVLMHCASVIGQLANDDHGRRLMTTKMPTLDFLLHLFGTAFEVDPSEPRPPELKLRVVFALKQLSLRDWRVQQRVGLHCIRSLVAELRVREPGAQASIVSSLGTLAAFKPNCTLMVEAGLADVVNAMRDEPHEGVMDRASQLWDFASRTHSRQQQLEQAVLLAS